MVSKVFDEIGEDVAAKAKKNTSHPQGLRMPRQIRKRFSDYYLHWAVAFSLENYRGLWKDAFALSISYNPFNIWAWGYSIASPFPSFMRSALIRARQHSPRLASIPYLRKIKQSFTRRRLFHTRDCELQ